MMVGCVPERKNILSKICQTQNFSEFSVRIFAHTYPRKSTQQKQTCDRTLSKDLSSFVSSFRFIIHLFEEKRWVTTTLMGITITMGFNPCLPLLLLPLLLLLLPLVPKILPLSPHPMEHFEGEVRTRTLREVESKKASWKRHIFWFVFYWRLGTLKKKGFWSQWKDVFVMLEGALLLEFKNEQASCVSVRSPSFFWQKLDTFCWVTISSSDFLSL